MEDYKKKEIKYEKNIAKDYNQFYYSNPIQKYQIKDFVRYVRKSIQRGDKVLDLGCGPASLWRELTKIKEIKLIGADISSKMITEAKKLYPKGRFIVADSEKLPLADEEFDVVICSSIFHHLPGPYRPYAGHQRSLCLPRSRTYVRQCLRGRATA